MLPMGSKSETSKIYGTINVLLSEKRTSLAVLRTAIAIFTLPLRNLFYLSIVQKNQKDRSYNTRNQDERRTLARYP